MAMCPDAMSEMTLVTKNGDSFGSRLVRGGHGKLCEQVHFAGLFEVHIAQNVKLLDFASKSCSEAGGVKTGDGAGSAYTG